MTEISLAEAKNRLSELVERANGGETITVLRRGKPAARLMPPESAEGSDRSAEVQEVFRALQKLSKSVELVGDLKAIARAGLD